MCNNCICVFFSFEPIIQRMVTEWMYGWNCTNFHETVYSLSRFWNRTKDILLAILNLNFIAFSRWSLKSVFVLFTMKINTELIKLCVKSNPACLIVYFRPQKALFHHTFTHFSGLIRYLDDSTQVAEWKWNKPRIRLWAYFEWLRVDAVTTRLVYLNQWQK